jgi:antirestriction protein
VSRHEDKESPPAPWSPDENVGDVYEAEIAGDGQVERAERLTEAPEIWVGSWLDYNNGILHGQWIDATQDEAGLDADIAAMLAVSPTSRDTGEPAEDWGIFDFDNFGSLRVGEQESLSWVSAVANGIVEHGLAFAAYADVMQDEDALTGFADGYLGHYESMEHYVEQLVADCGYDELLDQAVPQNLRPYIQIDVAGLARDMQLSGDVHALPADDGGVWLFDAR